MADSSNKTQEKISRKKSLRRRLANNRWIVANIPFYLFVAAITILYIANGHYADKTIRKINKTARQIKEMEYEFKTVKQDVIFRSKQSELARAVEPLGLQVPLNPPVRLTDTLQRR